VENNKLGEVFDAPLDVYRTEIDAYQPDILFISNERLYIIGDKKIEGAPDFVIEILSQSSAYYDLKHKKSVYEQSGMKEYWVVDPSDNRIQIYENSDNGFVLMQNISSVGRSYSLLLDGFFVDLEKVFGE
jgi:Uma2 family endonuclease